MIAWLSMALAWRFFSHAAQTIRQRLYQYTSGLLHILVVVHA
jgi:hypothetical protein